MSRRCLTPIFCLIFALALLFGSGWLAPQEVRAQSRTPTPSPTTTPVLVYPSCKTESTNYICDTRPVGCYGPLSPGQFSAKIIRKIVDPIEKDSRCPKSIYPNQPTCDCSEIMYLSNEQGLNCCVPITPTRTPTPTRRPTATNTPTPYIAPPTQPPAPPPGNFSGPNKFGLNVAGERGQDVMPYIGRDGWIVFLPNGATSPDSGRAQNVINEIQRDFFQRYGSSANYVLRGHFPGASNFPSDAWVNFWEEVINGLNFGLIGNKVIYFVPVNEPDLELGGDSGSRIADYVNKLHSALGGKVKMLSPSLRVSADRSEFENYSNSMGGAGFFSQFDGIAFNYYDIEINCTNKQPFCDSNYNLNPTLYKNALDIIGASGKPVFFTETGVQENAGDDYYFEPQIAVMLCELNKRLKGDDQFKMFSPLISSPQSGNWFFSGEATKLFYQERSEDCSKYNFGGAIRRAPKLEPLMGRDPYDRWGIRRTSGQRDVNWGNRYEKSPYCPAMGINQDANFPSLYYFRTCYLDESRAAIPGAAAFYSCPDYAPNREYPGDTCFNFTDIKQENMVDFKQPDFSIGERVQYPLCEKVPGRREASCLPDEHLVSVLQKTSVSYPGPSQDSPGTYVEYLGTTNEYTSNPNYIISLKNDITRTSLFLTDYLRGFFKLPGDVDRSWEMMEFLVAIAEYNRVTNDPNSTPLQKQQAVAKLESDLSKIPYLKERLQLTSGAFDKLATAEFKKKFDSNKVLLNRWLYANLVSSNPQKPKDKIEQTPIGDYVIGYFCHDTGRLLDEENFDDSLERRIATDGKKKTKCSAVDPIRISDFICGNDIIWADASITQGLDRDEICRGKKTYPGGEQIFSMLWPDYVPTFTREDTPVRVEVRCPSWPPTPPAYPITDHFLTEEEIRQLNVNNNPNQDVYAKDEGDDLEKGRRKYTIVTRSFIYIGHLAEARESAYYVGNILLPVAAQKKSKDAKMDGLNADIASGNLKSAVAKTGDLVAQDSDWRFHNPEDMLSDSWLVKKVVLDEGKKRAMAEYIDAVETRGGNPPVPKNSVEVRDTCEIFVEMPFIEELAARTIGKEAGFMREWLPKEVGDKLSEDVRSQAHRGANVAYSDYFQMNAKIEVAGTEIITATGQSHEAGRIYVPWVKEMQAFQTVALGYNLNPSAVIQNLGNTGTQTASGGNAQYQKCLTQGIDYKAQIDDATIEAAFRNFYPRIIQGEFGENFLKSRNIIEAHNIWTEMARTARAGGINPILALAYWGEETHFTSQDDNPDPKWAIGCGIQTQGTQHISCISSYPGNPESELRDEFRCIAGSNPAGTSCNLSAICKIQPDAWSFIGCYQFGVNSSNVPNTPTDNHVRNLIHMYYDLLGKLNEMPSCAP